jgi:hypothetical protein
VKRRRLLVSKFGLVLLLTAAFTLAQQPKYGPMETFKDWIIGCDNVGRCEAQSLAPEGADFFENAYTVGIRRDVSPRAGVEVWFPTEERGVLDFIVDGRKLASASAEGSYATVRGSQATELAIAMARGTRMEIKTGDKGLARPPLAGSSAALRYMDAHQGHAGTTAALVATGSRSEGTVKPDPQSSTVPQVVPDPAISATPLSSAERASAIKLADCADLVEPSDQLEVFSLSGSQALVLVPCGRGAYNINSVALVATGLAGNRSFVPAKLDSQPGPGVKGVDYSRLTNGSFDSTTGRLSNYYKGRVIGDCGDQQEYIWDGAGFRLVEARMMNECRGSREWITVGRAEPRPRR